MRKFVFLFAFFSFCASIFAQNAFSQNASLQNVVPYTNQFFASDTATLGPVFVFVYEDGFLFLKSEKENWTQSKARFNTERAQNGVYIAGDRFFNKQRETLYIYNLAKLTDPVNNGKKIDDIKGGFLDSVDNIGIVSVSSGSLFYTQTEPAGVFNYDSGKKTPVSGVTAKNIKAFLHQSLSVEQWKQDYEAAKKRVTSITTDYSAVENRQQYSDTIASAIEKLENPKSGKASSANLEKLTENVLSLYGYRKNEADFRKLHALSVLLGCEADAESVLKKIQRTEPSGKPSGFANYLGDYIDSSNEYKKLDQEGIKKGYNTGFKTAKEGERTRERESLVRFIDANNLEMAKNSFAKITNLIEEIKSYDQWKEKLGGSESNRKAALEQIKPYIVDSARKRLYEYAASLKPDASKFDVKYRDFCVLTDTYIRANGFKIDIPLTMSDFANLRSDSGNAPRLMHPAEYIFANPSGGNTFILTGKNSLAAVDYHNINTQTLDLPVISTKTPDIWYLLPGGAGSQYALTRGGTIVKYSVQSGALREERLPQTVTGGDTVMLDESEVYVFSTDAKINGAAMKSFNVSPGKHKIQVTLSGGQFTIGRVQ